MLAGADGPAAWKELARHAEHTARRGPTNQSRSQARTLALLLGAKRPRSRGARRSRALVGLAAVILAALVGILVARAVTTPPLHVTGPSRKIPLDLYAVGQLSFSATGNAKTLSEERWKLDGVDVTARVHVQGNKLVFRPLELLEQGKHKLVVTRSGGLLGAKAEQGISLTSTSRRR